MSRSQTVTAPVSTTFSQPIRAITNMLLVCLMVGAGAWVIHAEIIGVLQANPVLNGFIAFVFAIGVLTCFWQVWILAQSVFWIENVVRGTQGTLDEAPPRLLAPLAALLRSATAQLALSATSSRSIQESVAQRIDEARDITRYLINLLVFLGLLGTFWGLATTVPAVVETIRSLAPDEGESGLDVFGKLMGGLESQLGGMGTAFSSSLLGLAGSLVLGLLELFAGHGQNRFTRELEEWLSSITRIGVAAEDGGGDAGTIGLVMEQLADQMDQMQRLYSQAELARAQTDRRISELAHVLMQMSAHFDSERGQAGTLLRIAEGQDRLLTALGRLGAIEGDSEMRMRLRSIDLQLVRLLEEVAAGRQETMADLKGDLAALGAAIRHLGRTGG